MLKSKIFYATITDACLYYRGSITIDEVLLKAANLREGEQVDVLNLDNGSRIRTYAIKGKKNSGEICLNGPAARSGAIGNRVAILSYGIYTEKELKKYKAWIVEVDGKNRVKNSRLAG